MRLLDLPGHLIDDIIRKLPLPGNFRKLAETSRIDMSLLDLPGHLIEDIIRKLPLDDQKSLGSTCKRLRQLAKPFLVKHLNIGGHVIGENDQDALQSLLTDVPGCVQSLKWVLGPFVGIPGSICWQHIEAAALSNLTTISFDIWSTVSDFKTSSIEIHSLLKKTPNHSRLLLRCRMEKSRNPEKRRNLVKKEIERKLNRILRNYCNYLAHLAIHPAASGYGEKAEICLARHSASLISLSTVYLPKASGSKLQFEKLVYLALNANEFDKFVERADAPNLKLLVLSNCFRFKGRLTFLEPAVERFPKLEVFFSKSYHVDKSELESVEKLPNIRLLECVNYQFAWTYKNGIRARVKNRVKNNQMNIWNEDVLGDRNKFYSSIAPDCPIP